VVVRGSGGDAHRAVGGVQLAGEREVRVVRARLPLGAAAVSLVLAGPVVVRDVVARNRDHGGLEVGADHEELVLQDPGTLGVHDAVLAQERGAEHLVRCEAVDQGSVPHRAGLAGPAHQAVGHAALGEVAGGLADHDVRAVAPGGLVQPLQRLGGHAVVVVEELHILAPRLLHADVAGLPGPARVRYPDHPEVIVLGGQGLQQGGGVVLGAVVDEEDLELVTGQRLPQHRVDQRLDEAS
jgi:hypothetical protein